MKSKLLCLLLASFSLTSCVTSQHKEVYYLDLPLYSAVIEVDNPLYSYEDEQVRNHVSMNYVAVAFKTDKPIENKATIDIIPKKMSFLKFDRRVEQITLGEYEDMPNATITHIYKQDATLDNHPAIYNVYRVDYDNTSNRTVIMQYLIDYSPYYLVNLNYYANTEAEYEPIFSPRIGIEQTHGAALEYFQSFKLRYKVDDGDKETEQATPSKQML